MKLDCRRPRRGDHRVAEVFGLIGCSARTSANIGYGFSTTPMPALRLNSSNGSYSRRRRRGVVGGHSTCSRFTDADVRYDATTRQIGRDGRSAGSVRAAEEPQRGAWMTIVHVTSTRSARAADPAGRGGRHDGRPRLQPHLPGRQDQGHRRVVREPRHEARASCTPGSPASPSSRPAPVLVVGLLTPLAAGACIGRDARRVRSPTTARPASSSSGPARAGSTCMNLAIASARDRCARPGPLVARQRDRLPACTAGGASSIALVIGVGGTAALLVDVLAAAGRAEADAA